MCLIRKQIIDFMWRETGKVFCSLWLSHEGGVASMPDGKHEPVGDVMGCCTREWKGHQVLITKSFIF